MTQLTIIFSPGGLGRLKDGGFTVVISYGRCARGKSCWISEMHDDLALLSSDFSFLMQVVYAFLPSSPLPAKQMWKFALRECSRVASMSRQLVKSSLGKQKESLVDFLVAPTLFSFSHTFVFLLPSHSPTSLVPSSSFLSPFSPLLHLTPSFL